MYGKTVSQFLIEQHIALWNHVVGKRLVVREEGNHVILLHPTKGYRKVAKKRLGLR